MEMSQFPHPLINLPFVGDTATWAVMMRAGGATLEAKGPYQRRTARTRTTILTQAGPLDLSVPVHTGHSLVYKDTRINYDTRWDRQMMYALKTAYNSSPFFEFFEREFADLLSRRYAFLWDLNADMLETISSLAGIGLNIKETDRFAPATEGQVDLRIAVEIKFAHKMRDLCAPVEYTQVFATPYTERPFTPWMSVLDLLFNMGPESRNVLRAMAAAPMTSEKKMTRQAKEAPTERKC